MHKDFRCFEDKMFDLSTLHGLVLSGFTLNNACAFITLRTPRCEILSGKDFSSWRVNTTIYPNAIRIIYSAIAISINLLLVSVVYVEYWNI